MARNLEFIQHTKSSECFFLMIRTIMAVINERGAINITKCIGMCLVCDFLVMRKAIKRLKMLFGIGIIKVYDSSGTFKNITHSSKSGPHCNLSSLYHLLRLPKIRFGEIPCVT